MTTQDAAIWPLRALARPRLLAIVCIAMLAAAGWFYLGLILAGMSGAGVLEALCRPSFGAAAPGVSEAVLVLAMWCATALAMMLPTPAPLIRTYADIRE